MSTLYRITTKTGGMTEPFVDWYWADSEEAALEQAKADSISYGLPVERTAFLIREATEQEKAAIQPLTPLNPIPARHWAGRGRK